jgi:hypothetical protein
MLKMHSKNLHYEITGLVDSGKDFVVKLIKNGTD